MSFEADMLVARRRMRRKLTFWRIAAIVLAFVALASMATYFGGDPSALTRGPHIARVNVDGFIDDDRRQQAMLRKIADDDRVEALILAINSPGGTTTGSEALYEAVRAVAAKKPVVATLGTVAASGGYITAIAADHIVARGNTITGSIGVIFQWANVQDLLGRIGVSFDEVKSSPLKAEPDPFTDTPPEARAVMDAMVADSYNWFVDLVGERRKLPALEARRLGDGRVYTGRQALSAKLIDAIGGEREARDWLAETHSISRDLTVRQWQPEEEIGALALLQTLTRLAGLDALAARLDMLSGRATLDGLLAVWHASDLEAE